MALLESCAHPWASHYCRGLGFYDRAFLSLLRKDWGGETTLTAALLGPFGTEEGSFSKEAEVLGRQKQHMSRCLQCSQDAALIVPHPC